METIVIVVKLSVIAVGMFTVVNAGLRLAMAVYVFTLLSISKDLNETALSECRSEFRAMSSGFAGGSMMLVTLYASLVL